MRSRGRRGYGDEEQGLDLDVANLRTVAGQRTRARTRSRRREGRDDGGEGGQGMVTKRKANTKSDPSTHVTLTRNNREATAAQRIDVRLAVLVSEASPRAVLTTLQIHKPQ